MKSRTLNLKSCWVKAALALVLTGAVGAASAALVEHDLSTGTGPVGVTVNGAIFITPPNPEINSGTGFWDPFVRIQNSNGSATGGCGQGSKQYCEQGYNTSDPVQFDEKDDPNYTRDLKLSEVPIVIVDGIRYLEFLLDIAEPAADNENQDKHLLSLDQLQLFVGADQATNTNAGEYSNPEGNGSLGTLNALYTLDFAGGDDNYLKLDYNLVGSGNGRADMIALIPEKLVADANMLDGNNSVYLFSRFGDQQGPPASLIAEGSFEEWAVRGTSGGGGGGGGGGVPEPGTLALFGVAMLAGLFNDRRRRQARA